MSARDRLGAAMEECLGHMAPLWFRQVSAMPIPDRLALARALVPEMAVVPREPTVAMLLDGFDAAREVRQSGLSGMTIDAQIRRECAREDAIYRAMLAAAEQEMPHE